MAFQLVRSARRGTFFKEGIACRPQRSLAVRIAERGSLFRCRVSDVEAAKQINDQRMHILFNIQGYTQGERNEIFALKPAPVQVLYKGFVGTLGASYVGHMVSDRLVSPPEYAEHSTEKFIYMPHTYVVNDYRSVSEWGREAACESTCPLARWGVVTFILIHLSCGLSVGSVSIAFARRQTVPA